MSEMRTQMKKIKTPTDYVVQHLLDIEQDYKILYEHNRNLERQLKAYQEFQDNVLKIAEKYLVIKKCSTDGDPFVSMEYLWESREPELFDFIRRNLKAEIKDE